MPKAKTSKPAPAIAVSAIKGFDKDLKCLGFAFKIGETYKHDGPVEVCATGFHSVTGHPLAVFGYYAPAGSRYCRVEISGIMHSDDQTKTAAEILAVGQEIGISDLVNDAIKWVKDRSHPEGQHATGDQGASSATGTRGASSATGYQGASSATGDQGASSATGYQGASSATGTRGAAMSVGLEGKVMGAIGNALFSLERAENGDVLSVACGVVGQDGILPDVFYRACNGKLEQV